MPSLAFIIIFIIFILHTYKELTEKKQPGKDGEREKRRNNMVKGYKWMNPLKVNRMKLASTKIDRKSINKTSGN